MSASPLSFLNALCEFYAEFDKTRMAQLGDFYHPNIVFCDPLHRIEGLEALKVYFEGMAENLTFCRFRFHSSPRLTDDGNAFLVWTMDYAHPKLAAGKPLQLEGCSHVQFQQQRIHYHRDYFDAGAMLYEHLPLLGFVLGRIKQRLG